jgi:hypothetical protein
VAGVGGLAVGTLGDIQLAAERILALGLDNTARVHDEDVLALDAQPHHHVQAGDGRRTRARRHELDVADGLAHQFEAVEQRRRRDDGRAVLVVMEDGDVQPVA